jgi:acetylornithine deacetylase
MALSRLYEVLDRLIAFNTVSDRSDVPAMSYLAGLLEHQGFKAHLHHLEVSGVPQANLIAWAGPPQPDGLIISGHLDTVPVEGQPGWVRDPFRMELTDDHVFGRGTSDMKGFIAQSVDAASQLDRSRLVRPIVFVFTADEEVGGYGAHSLAPELNQILGDVPRPNQCWIGEPTSYEVLHTHKSIGMVEVKVRGRGGHSGAPEQGVNAIAVMGKVLETLGRLQAERRAARDANFAATFPDSPYDVMNLGTISGGIALNVIAEECILKLSYRCLPDRDPHELYRELSRRLGAIDPHDYGSPHFTATIEVGEPHVLPPMLSPRDTPLEAALATVTGQTSTHGAPYWTDGGWFAQVGIASLICGPGEYAQAHRPNESIPRGAFERGPALMLKVIERICC